MLDPQPPHLPHLIPPPFILLVARNNHMFHLDSFSCAQFVLHLSYALRERVQRGEARLGVVLVAPIFEIAVSGMNSDVLTKSQ